MTDDELTDRWEAGVLFPLASATHSTSVSPGSFTSVMDAPKQKTAWSTAPDERAMCTAARRSSTLLSPSDGRTCSLRRSTAEDSEATPTSSSLRTPSYDAETFSASPAESVAFKPEAPRRPIGWLRAGPRCCFGSTDSHSGSATIRPAYATNEKRATAWVATWRGRERLIALVLALSAGTVVLARRSAYPELSGIDPVDLSAGLEPSRVRSWVWRRGASASSR